MRRNTPITSTLSCHFLPITLPFCLLLDSLFPSPHLSSYLPSFSPFPPCLPVPVSSVSSVYLSFSYPSTHIALNFSSQSALHCVCVRRKVVFQSVLCVERSVHLSGFCGRSMLLHREAGMELGGVGVLKNGEIRLKRNVENEVRHGDSKMN